MWAKSTVEKKSPITGISYTITKLSQGDKEILMDRSPKMTQRQALDILGKIILKNVVSIGSLKKDISLVSTIYNLPQNEILWLLLAIRMHTYSNESEFTFDYTMMNPFTQKDEDITYKEHLQPYLDKIKPMEKQSLEIEDIPVYHEFTHEGTSFRFKILRFGNEHKLTTDTSNYTSRGFSYKKDDTWFLIDSKTYKEVSVDYISEFLKQIKIAEGYFNSSVTLHNPIYNRYEDEKKLYMKPHPDVPKQVRTSLFALGGFFFPEV